MMLPIDAKFEKTSQILTLNADQWFKLGVSIFNVFEKFFRTLHLLWASYEGTKLEDDFSTMPWKGYQLYLLSNEVKRIVTTSWVWKAEANGGWTK